jgi:hypothetical protein
MIDTRGAGLDRTQARFSHGARHRPDASEEPSAVRQLTRPRAAALAERIAGAWRGRRGDARPVAPAPHPDVERRLDALDTRMEHLEAALEGLQDALYRQAIREDESRAALHRRTDPERIARELSADARRRGL